MKSTPGVGFYGYRAGLYGGWAGYPADIETVHYQVGTLSIDLVDAEKNQLVWEGVAQGRVSSDVARKPAGKIDEAVSEIFAKFPTPAATSAAS